MHLHKGFNSAKCKTSLKLSATRIKLLKNTKLQSVTRLRREISQLLEAGLDQTARIRVEHVIREEKTIAAYEFIEIYCELIAARLQIIESQKICPMDLKEAIASVIFASRRCQDVAELSDVRKRLAAKYGKEFVTAALELRPNSGVSSLMVEKLSVETPDIETKLRVLTSIATEYDINWEPKSFEEQVKKSQDDRLDGPSSFGAVKVVTEPTISESSVRRIHSDEPSTKPLAKEVQSTTSYSVSTSTDSSVPTKPPEKEVESQVKYSASPSISSSVPTKYQTEPGPSEPRTLSENSLAGGTDDSLKLKKQNMEYKDAISAALAAAKSAERANQAARAAAEFASQTGPRQFETGHGETSQAVEETASTLKAAKVQADFKDPGFDNNRMKETSRVPKLSEHRSSEVMQHDSRAKSKAKEEYFEGPRNLSSRIKSPSPSFSVIDKPVPTFTDAGKSSQRITSDQVIKHGQSSPKMQDDLIEKHSAPSEEDEVEEQVTSNSSLFHRVEEHFVVSDSHYHGTSNDDDSFSSVGKLSFPEDIVGNYIHDEGKREEHIGTQSDAGRIEFSSFKSVSSSLDENTHSAMQNRKNDFHTRDDSETDDISGGPTYSQQESFNKDAVYDDDDHYDDNQIDLFNNSNDNVIESIFRFKYSDSSLHQDFWHRKDSSGEPPIEKHVNLNIFSTETTQTEDAEDVIEDSPSKFIEVVSPKYDEPLSPNYDEVDQHHSSEPSDSEDGVDISSHHREGRLSSTVCTSYPGREGSLNLQSGQGLNLNTLSGFRNNGFIRPPFTRVLPESHLSSKEREDDPYDRSGHGSKWTSEEFLENKASTLDFKHSSSDKSRRRENKSHESKESPQHRNPRGIQRSGGVAQSVRRDSSLFFNHESRPISREQDTEREIKPSQSSSNDIRSMWNDKFMSSKSLKDEDDDSSQRMDKYSMESSESSLYDSAELREETKTVSGSELSSCSHRKAEAEISSPSNSDIKAKWNRKFSQSSEKRFVLPVQTDISAKELLYSESPVRPEPKRMLKSSDGSPSKSDLKERRSSKYSTSQLSGEQLVPPVGRNESSKKELFESRSPVCPAPEGSLKSADGSPSKSDLKERRSKYSTSQLSEEQRGLPVGRNESSKRELLAPASTVQHTTKEMTGSPDSSPSKSSMRHRKYSPWPSEQLLGPPVQINTSSKELHASPSTTRPGTRGTSEPSNGLRDKSAVQRRWSDKHSTSQTSEKDLVTLAQRSKTPNKESPAAPSAAQPRPKRVPKASEKHVAPPVQANEIAANEPHTSPPTMQPMTVRLPESPDDLFKQEKPESQSSRQPPSVQPEGIVRSASVSGAASVQTVPSGLASTSTDSTESQRSRQVPAADHLHRNMPRDYDDFAAQFKALKLNHRKK